MQSMWRSCDLQVLITELSMLKIILNVLSHIKVYFSNILFTFYWIVTSTEYEKSNLLVSDVLGSSSTSAGAAHGRPTPGAWQTPC